MADIIKQRARRANPAPKPALPPNPVAPPRAATAPTPVAAPTAPAPVASAPAPTTPTPAPAARAAVSGAAFGNAAANAFGREMSALSGSPTIKKGPPAIKPVQPVKRATK